MTGDQSSGRAPSPSSRALRLGHRPGDRHRVRRGGRNPTVADRDPRVTAVASAVNARRGEILDATSESAVDAVVSRIVADDGGLDVLVCAHGILTQSAPPTCRPRHGRTPLTWISRPCSCSTGQRCGRCST